MKHKNFAILLSCTVLAKIVGIIYRVVLVNLLGAQGVGTLQLALPVYTFTVTIISGGIGAVIARTVSGAKETKHGDFEAFTNTCCLFLGFTGAILSVAFVFISPVICSLLGNSEAALPLAFLAPSFAFCSVSACIKGYFQGKHKMAPTSVSIIIEQGAKLAFSTLIALYLLQRAPSLAVAGTALGITVSELAVCTYLVVLYLKKRSYKGSVKPSMLAAHLKTIAVSSASVIIVPLSQLIDSVIIVNLLSPDLGTSLATSFYGLLSGPVSSIVNIPSIITGALVTYLLPKISEDNDAGVRLRFCRITKLTVLGCGVFTASVAIFAPTVIDILYPALTSLEREVCSHLLQICAAESTFVCVMRLTAVHLQGLNDFTTPTLSLIGAVLIKTLLTLVLVPPLSIYGCAVASVSAYAFSFLVNTLVFRKRISFDFSTKSVFSTVCCFGLFTCIAFGIYYLFPSVIGAVTAFFIALLVLLAFVKAFNIIDLKRLY